MNFSKKNLTEKEQKEWERKLIGYVLAVNIFDQTLIHIAIPQLKAKLKDDSTKIKVIISCCDSITAYCKSIHGILEKAYNDVRDHQVLEFDSDLPFPPSPPKPPSSGSDDKIMWFQLAWDIIRPIINLIAKASSEIRVLVVPLETAVDKLLSDLAKYFKPPIKAIKLELVNVENLPINEFPKIDSIVIPV